MSGLREATAYLQIENVPAGNTYDSGTKAAVRGVTNKKPDVIRPGCIVVKVRLRIPSAAWEPFQPEDVIDVPADLVQRPIDVEAVDP